jgi:hypothetical protein
MGDVENCRPRLDDGDAIERIGVLPELDSSLKECATEGLLVAGEILVSENASCKLICEVFRISLPESFIRGLNIAITCCRI